MRLPLYRLFVVVKNTARNQKSHSLCAQYSLIAIMPRSDSDDDSSKLIYNGSKGQWSNFNQEATVYTMSSEVMTAFKDGEAVKIDDQDDLGSLISFLNTVTLKLLRKVLLREIVTRLSKTIKLWLEMPKSSFTNGYLCD